METSPSNNLEGRNVDRPIRRHRHKAPGGWWVAAAVLLTAGVFGLLMMPLPGLGRVTQSVSNVLHAPAFALLAVVCWLALRRWPGLSARWSAGLAWVGVVGFGVASEFAQRWVDRDPGWNDALANALGATAGLAWVLSGSRVRRGTRLLCRSAAVVVVLAASWKPLCVFYDAVVQRSEMPTLASFEHELELLRWKLREAEVDRVRSHATDGEWSLKVDMTTGKYPGVALRYPPPDWSAFEAIVFDVLVKAPPGPAALDRRQLLELIVKIHDDRHNGKKHDRFHRVARLTPGRHEIRILLSDVEQAPRDRRLDLDQVTLLQIYTARPPIPRTIYLDNVRLE